MMPHSFISNNRIILARAWMELEPFPETQGERWEYNHAGTLQSTMSRRSNYTHVFGEWREKVVKRSTWFRLLWYFVALCLTHCCKYTIISFPTALIYYLQTKKIRFFIYICCLKLYPYTSQFNYPLYEKHLVNIVCNFYQTSIFQVLTYVRVNHFYNQTLSPSEP